MRELIFFRHLIKMPYSAVGLVRLCICVSSCFWLTGCAYGGSAYFGENDEVMEQMKSGYQSQEGYLLSDFNSKDVSDGRVNKIVGYDFMQTSLTLVGTSDDSVIDASPIVSVSVAATDPQEPSTWNGPKLTVSKGVNDGPSGRETWYNMDMSGCISAMRSLDSKYKNYEYTVRSDGVKLFGGYVMIAANLKTRPKGTLVPTSLGMGIVVDTGGFVKKYPNGIDIAVNWKD